MGSFFSCTFRKKSSFYVYNIFEINEKQNTEIQQKFAKKIEELGQFISEELHEKGKGYLFFNTAYEDIYSYIKDKDKTVMVCLNDKNEIIAASYITQGQGLYTYDDLTKYFKFGKEYKEYVKSKYDPKELCYIEYETYMKKIQGYKYAKELIIKELNITDLVDHCKREKEKGTFDEKNKVREKVNAYIYNYFKNNNNGKIGLLELERFYLLNFSDLQNCENEEIRIKCENDTKENKIWYKEYDELLNLFDLKDAILPDEKGDQNLKPEEFKKFFDANPLNTIELDTYMVHPDYRLKGFAKTLTSEGTKIQIGKLLAKNQNLEEIFISLTIHQDNDISKKVIQSLGKFDTINIKRRTGINRGVYFCKIPRKNFDEFIRNNNEKIEKIKEKLKNNENIILKKIELK